MEIKLTEAMTMPLPENKRGTLSLKAYAPIQAALKNKDVLVIGPGLSRNLETQQLIRKIIVSSCIPLVLDADGINALEGHTEILAKIKSSAIITPHPLEFSRLFSVAKNKVNAQRGTYALEYSCKYKVTIVLKGHKTIVVNKRKKYINTTGNPGLATGGSGDVLAGIIGAFMANNMNAFNAAKYGTFIHGLAADVAIKEKTATSLIPSDLLDYLPNAFKKCDL